MKSIKNGKNEDKEITKCPSCGRSVPKLSYCKSCGASLEPAHRIATKSVLLFVLIIAGLGVGMLAYGFIRGNYISPIGSINAGMEGDTVRIQGYITDIEYWETYERTTFEISDKSNNRIKVSGWSEFTSDIKEEGYPEVGDKVIVEGTVDVYQDEVSIEVTDANSIIITYQSPSPYNIGDIDQYSEIEANNFNLLYKKVNITGEITDYNEYDYGNTLLIEIEESFYDINVKTTPDRISFSGAMGETPVVLDEDDIGSDVQIIGMIDVYWDYNSPQILPSTMTNKSIQILS